MNQLLTWVETKTPFFHFRHKQKEAKIDALIAKFRFAKFRISFVQSIHFREICLRAY
jgi:hypothetical protein